MSGVVEDMTDIKLPPSLVYTPFIICLSLDCVHNGQLIKNWSSSSIHVLHFEQYLLLSIDIVSLSQCTIRDPLNLEMLLFWFQVRRDPTISLNFPTVEIILFTLHTCTCPYFVALSSPAALCVEDRPNPSASYPFSSCGSRCVLLCTFLSLDSPCCTFIHIITLFSNSSVKCQWKR